MDSAPITAIRAASTGLAVSANNVANILTPDFKASRSINHEAITQNGTEAYVAQADSEPDLGTEMVDQLVTLRYAQANGKVIKTQSQMMGTILDMFA